MVRSVKITVVGDSTVGKTCLLHVYTLKSFPCEYVPTVFDNYVAYHRVDDTELELSLADTAGQEEYARLRPISYNRTDCFLLCYSVNHPDSFEHVTTKWLPELQHYKLGTPVVLVATKTDLRRSVTAGQTLLTTQDGKKMKEMIRAAELVECSARDNFNVAKAFEAAVRAALNRPRPKRFCMFL